MCAQWYVIYVKTTLHYFVAWPCRLALARSVAAIILFRPTI